MANEDNRCKSLSQTTVPWCLKILQFACCIALLAVPSILLTICINTRLKSPINQLDNPGDIANVYQIVEDWRTQPLVSLSVHQNSCPTD